MSEKTYPINERFATWQGEGVFMGRRAFFIRTHGCPLHCPWCDSAGTWHPNYVPADVPKMTPSELIKEVLAANMTRVVLTGGEPTIFDLDPLISAFHQAGFSVALETSGAFEVKGYPDWITLSPKKWKLPIIETVTRANEFKFIIETPEDIDFYLQAMLNRGLVLSDRLSIWLHPEWSKRQDKAVLNAISERVKLADYFRAGWQLHKCYQVDQLDKRTRPLVPLGGDPERGY